MGKFEKIARDFLEIAKDFRYDDYLETLFFYYNNSLLEWVFDIVEHLEIGDICDYTYFLDDLGFHIVADSEFERVYGVYDEILECAA